MNPAGCSCFLVEEKDDITSLVFLSALESKKKNIIMMNSSLLTLEVMPAA